MATPDTIVAVSSAAGVAERAIIRLSGPDAVKVAEALFRGNPATQNPKSKTQNRLPDWSVTRGALNVSSLSAPVPCLLYVMMAPRSYTREDVVEFHVVGSPPIVSAVLAEVMTRGVRSARPGEFTERAYLNGRIDLSQAEAVLKVIRSTSDAERRLALGELTGELSKRVAGIAERLTDLLARIELALDFSEDDVPAVDAKAVASELSAAATDVEELLRSGDASYVYAERPRVGIVGRTNVGKSSLFNRLLGRDEAIVTPVAGTTRDVLEAEVEVGGTKVLLVDTAGEKEERSKAQGSRLREETDPDDLAILRARAEREQADLLLIVVDSSAPLTSIDWGILEDLNKDFPLPPPRGEGVKQKDRLEVLHGNPKSKIQNPKSTMVVLNKTDMPLDKATDLAVRSRALAVPVSCATGQGLDLLRSEIAAALTLRGVDRSGLRFLLNLRQLDSLRLAADSLGSARSAAAEGLGLEFAAADIRVAVNRLRELTHPLDEDEILDRIFSRFCIGK